MTTFNKWKEILQTRMEADHLEPVQYLSSEPRSFVCVLTVPDPRDSSKHISNVLCRYHLAGNEVSFQKNPFDSDESFEDALNWAKSFAQRHGIVTVYASNFSNSPRCGRNAVRYSGISPNNQ